MQTTVIWLSLFVLFLVIEIITMGLTTIWFAGGALVAFLVAVLGLGLGVQIIIFAIVSLALLAVTRPLAMKYFNQERQKTGAELLIGQGALPVLPGHQGFKERLRHIGGSPVLPAGDAPQPPGKEISKGINSMSALEVFIPYCPADGRLMYSQPLSNIR